MLLRYVDATALSNPHSAAGLDGAAGPLVSLEGCQLLILRYEVAVLRRAKPKPALNWAGRAVFSAFARLLSPAIRRHCLVTPGTCCAGTVG